MDNDMQPIGGDLDPFVDGSQEPIERQADDQTAAGRDEPVDEPRADSSDDWYRQDSKAFAEAFPDVNRQQLFNREDFVDFAEGKIGQMPMAEIYRRYLKWHSPPSARELARQAAPGALGRAQPPAEGEFFTLNEIRKMSPAEIDRQWDKVQRSLKHISR